MLINQTKSARKRSKRSQIWNEVLQIVGESVTPLSGREVEIKWYKKYQIVPLFNTKTEQKKAKEPKGSIDSKGKRKYKKEMSYGDIYRIIRELAGFSSRKTVLLCKLNKIFPNSEEMDQEYLRNLVNRVRKLVRLPLIIYQVNDLLRTEFQVDPKRKEIILLFKKWTRDNNQWKEIVMKIKLTFTETTSLLLEIQRISDLPLYVKCDKHGELWLYLFEDDIEEDHLWNKTRFIKYTLNKSAQNRILKLEEGIKSTPFRDAETEEIFRDWRCYWPESESDKKHLLEIQTIKK